MTDLPDSGYISDDARTVQEQKDALEAVRDVVSELPGGDAITTLGIVSGSVTADRGTHRIDTENQDASDVLERIAQTNTPDGRLLTIIQADPARAVTVRHLATGDGEIQLSAGRDIILSKRHCIFLQRIGSRWAQTFETRFGPAAGVVEQFAGATPPTGAVWCYGQLLNVADEPELFAVLGTTFGGDGVTTFGVPDLRDRVAIGKGDMGGTPAGRMPTTGPGSPGIDTSQLGATGGVDRHQLIDGELAATTPIFSGTALGNHDHNLRAGTGTQRILSDDAAAGQQMNVPVAAGIPRPNNVHTLDIQGASAGTPSGTISSFGNDQAHQNVQPGLVLNSIIWT